MNKKQKQPSRVGGRKSKLKAASFSSSSSLILSSLFCLPSLILRSCSFDYLLFYSTQSQTKQKTTHQKQTLPVNPPNTTTTRSRIPLPHTTQPHTLGFFYFVFSITTTAALLFCFSSFHLLRWLPSLTAVSSLRVFPFAASSLSLSLFSLHVSTSLLSISLPSLQPFVTRSPPFATSAIAISEPCLFCLHLSRFYFLFRSPFSGVCREAKALSFTARIAFLYRLFYRLSLSPPGHLSTPRFRLLSPSFCCCFTRDPLGHRSDRPPRVGCLVV